MRHPIRTGQLLPDCPLSLMGAHRPMLLEFLAQESRPTILVMLPNLGHPISRAMLQRYLKDLPELTDARLAVVVRSDSTRLAGSVEHLPFPLICDGEGSLYTLFGVEEKPAWLVQSSEGRRIMRQAKAQGYAAPKKERLLLPLTIAADPSGRVLFCRYGESCTDLPENCKAVQRVAAALLKTQKSTALPAGEGDAEAAPTVNG